MKSAILTNTLKKLESDLSIEGDERRRDALNSIVAFLKKSYREYFSCADEQKKLMISDIILEQKGQINGKIEQLTQTKEEKLLNRLYTTFLLKNVELEKSMNDTEDKLEKMSISSVKSDIQGIMDVIQKHFILENQKNNNRNQLPVPTRKYNVVQELFKKVRKKIYDFTTYIGNKSSRNADEPSKRTYAAKHIRDYLFSQNTENEANKSNYNPQVFEKQTNQMLNNNSNKKRRQVNIRGYASQQQVNYTQQQNPRGIGVPPNVPSYGAPQQANYGQYQNPRGMGVPPNAPGYGAPQQANYGQYQNPRGMGVPPNAPGYGAPQQANYGQYQNPRGIGVPPIAPGYGAPQQANYGQYQNPRGMGVPPNAPGYGAPQQANYGQYQAPRGPRRPVYIPECDVQQPVRTSTNKIMDETNHEFVIPFEKLGVDPSKVKDKTKLEINGKKYIKTSKGLIEVIEQHSNEGDER